MDKSFDTENFGSVWRRVEQSSESMPVQDTAGIIGKFIDGEYKSALYYKAMAMRSRSRAAEAAFIRLSDMEYAHMRRLQTEYFILTGDIKKTTRENFIISSFPEALRRRYSAEREEMDAYKKASLQISDRRIAGIMESISKEEAGHMELIYGMIEKLIR